MIGQIVGNYKIEAKLGEGGMGAVYKGVDTMLDREVAIKALRPELASQDSIVERFRKEAVTLAKLNHPNIATLYSMFRQGDELFMVLEYVRGATLDSILHERGSLPATEALPIFCQVLDGIDHAHELGIIHRDIKPANMMFTEKGTLKVLDFGIARLLGSSRMTRAGNIIGTLEYMAPEQVKGLETDGRSDIYALGMMLYEVLTGRLPFQTENEFELMKAQTEMLPRPPREINPSIPVEVEAAIMKAVQKDPNDRFQTGGDFRESLIASGYAGNGAGVSVTGNIKIGGPPTHPSNPPISASTPMLEMGGGAIKGTRVGNLASVLAEIDGAKPDGAPVITQSKASNLNETRLGIAATAPPAPDTLRDEAKPSFFSKLTAVHYIGAGVALLVLFGVFLAVGGAVLFAVSGGSENTNTNKVETKPAVTNQKTETTVAEPSQPKPATQMTPPPFSDSGAPKTLQPTVPPPVDNNPPADRSPSAPKPVTPKKPAPAPKTKKKSAEDLLTGP